MFFVPLRMTIHPSKYELPRFFFACLTRHAFTRLEASERRSFGEELLSVGTYFTKDARKQSRTTVALTKGS